MSQVISEREDYWLSHSVLARSGSVKKVMVNIKLSPAAVRVHSLEKRKEESAESFAKTGSGQTQRTTQDKRVLHAVADMEVDPEAAAAAAN